MKLKLCPMCGGEAGHAQPEVTCVGVLYGNFCKVCTLSLTGFETQQSADKAWNTRPDLKPLHDLAEKWKYLWYDLSGDSGGYGECAKELRKALKQMEA